MKKTENTKKAGGVTIFFFKEKNLYVAVCLELDIVKEGKDLDELRDEIQESVIGYIETVCKGRYSDDLLNRPAPKKYWDKHSEFLKFLREKNQRKETISRSRTRGIETHVMNVKDVCMA